MQATKVCCPHRPLHIERVLDAHIDWTDALTTCHNCGAYFLAEMVDQTQANRAFRMTELDPQAAQQTLRSLAQGSCDLNRASAELSHLASSGQVLATILMVASNGDQSWHVLPNELRLPSKNWRKLKCDGALIEKILCG